MRNFLIFLLLFTSLQAQKDYQLGEGYQVEDLPLYLGGYLSLDYKSADKEDRYRINDIAVLAYGNQGNFSYMAEVESKEFYVKKYSPDIDNTTYNTKLYLERLYVDYNINENYLFRVGKYNSPIGFWNLHPINVLRETTSSPNSTFIIYPKFTTGLSASYRAYGTGELKIDYMLQNNEDLDHKYNNYKIDKHYGVGISYEEDDFTFKVNGGHFHRVNHTGPEDEIYYILLSTKYETDKYQVLTELGRQRSNDTITTNYAGYIQGVYRYTQKHIGILRLEAYDDNVNNVAKELMILGYTYRPLYPVAIKYEYQLYSQNQLDQILLSLSVLF